MAFVSRALIDSLAEGDPARLARLSLRFARPVHSGRDDRDLDLGRRRGREVYRFETLDPRGAPVVTQGRSRDPEESR